jgi:hypothetical protein
MKCAASIIIDEEFVSTALLDSALAVALAVAVRAELLLNG